MASILRRLAELGDNDLLKYVALRLKRFGHETPEWIKLKAIAELAKKGHDFLPALERDFPAAKHRTADCAALFGRLAASFR